MTQLEPRTPSEPNADFGLEEAQRLDRLIAKVRRNLRLRRCLQGFAWFCVLSLAALVAAIGIIDAVKFDWDTVAVTRPLLYGLIASLFVLLVAVRLIETLSSRGLGRYLEAAAPELDAMIPSAMEARARQASGGNHRANPGAELDAILMARTVERCRDLRLDRDLEPPRMHGATWTVIGVAVITLVLGLFGPVPFQHGLKLLFVGSDGRAVANPYRIVVEPGDVSLPFGTNLQITAATVGFSPRRLELMVRRKGDAMWTAHEMRSAEQARYLHHLLNLKDDAEYFVRSDHLESAVHQLDVLPRPAISAIDVQYRYPKQTGRNPVTERDIHHLAALEGTQAGLSVHPAPELAGHPLRAQIVLDDERVIPLDMHSDKMIGDIDIVQDGHFRVEMAVAGSAMLPVTPELSVQVLSDGLPTISFVRPGNDTKVTSIEELELAVRAQDDIAVRDLKLIYSINGGEDRHVSLPLAAEHSVDLTRSHRLFLEDYALSPGDLIAVHASTTDTEGDQRRTVLTDIYFLEVRPFDQEFREAGGAGQGGGGGGGQQRGEEDLAAQQKALVVALFKVVRDRAKLDDEEHAERSETLMEAQDRIRARVDAISRRIGSRPMIGDNEGYKQMARELPKASAAMLQAQAALTIADTQDALNPARKALLHLQRAFAAFREVQVARQNAQGNGRGRTDANDLANLFKLEMDKFQSRYDHVQRSRGAEQAQQALDGVMERLRELARRQQREVERAAIRAGRGLGGAESQRELLAQLEEAVRELERLTRKKQPEADVEAAKRELDAARQAMQQAAENPNIEQSRKALERLRAAAEQLGQGGKGSFGQAVERAARKASQLAEDQDRIRRDINELTRQDDQMAGGRDPVRAGTETSEAEQGHRAAKLDRDRQLLERKRDMAEALTELTEDLESATQQAKPSQTKAQSEVRRIARDLRRNELKEQVEDSRRRLAAGQSQGRLEAEIQRGLNRLRDELQNVAEFSTSGGTHAAGREETRARLRELMRAMAEVNRHAMQDAQSAAQSSAGQNAGQAQTGGDGRGAESRRGAGGGWHALGGSLRGLRDEIRAQGSALRGLRSIIDDSIQTQSAAPRLLEEVETFTNQDEAWADGERLAELSQQLLRRLQYLEFELRGDSPDSGPAEGAMSVSRQQRNPNPLADEYFRRLSAN